MQLEIYQGEDPDALKNVRIGMFTVEGLQSRAGANPVLCRMRLDLDGVLHVTAIEKETGLSKHVQFAGATRRQDEAQINRSRADLEELFRGRFGGAEGDAGWGGEMLEGQTVEKEAGAKEVGDKEVGDKEAGAGKAPDARPPAGSGTAESTELVERCRKAMPSMHDEDREEAVNLTEEVVNAAQGADPAALAKACESLREFLFFVEGR